MKVKELIRKPVTSCTADTDVGAARDLMKLKGISAVPVVEVDGDKINIEGIVSYHDLAGVYDDNVLIQQVMTTHIYAVTPDTLVQDAAKIMIDKKIHHLVAMSEGELVGIISSFDFVKMVAES